MHNRPSLRLALVAGLVFALSGCGSTQPMRLALTELGTTSDSEYGAYGLRLIRAVNITGLGPEEVVGTMTTDPDKWSIREQLAKLSPFRSDLPDTMTPRIRPGTSQIVERKFCKTSGTELKQCENGGVKLAELTTLRDGLQKYQQAVADAMNAALKQEALVAARNVLSRDDDAARAALANLQAMFPEDSKTTLKDLAAARTQAAKSADEAFDALNAKFEATRAALNTSGVLVTNWEREVAVSGSADAGESLQASASKKKKISGFLILGEPSSISLQIGSDIFSRINDKPPVGAAWTERVFKRHRNYFTYYQLRAKYVVFAESNLSALQGALKADTEALMATLGSTAAAATFASKVAALKLKVDAAYAAVAAASEAGAMDASQSVVSYRDFSFDRAQMAAPMALEMERAKASLPVISMRFALDDYIAVHRDEIQKDPPH